MRCGLIVAAATVSSVSAFNPVGPAPRGGLTNISPSDTASNLAKRNVDDDECSLSPSVLASCDTLPSFPTAHGLLCPETVQRMERSVGRNNRVVARFLDRYNRHGPMSCVDLLSDPEVLPHLTSAMRDLA